MQFGVGVNKRQISALSRSEVGHDTASLIEIKHSIGIWQFLIHAMHAAERLRQSVHNERLRIVPD